MSTLTKEQIMKFANAWQAFILILPWYMSTFGIDTLNRLLFGVALLVVFVILFLNRDNTEKVAVAVGTVDRFIKSQAETIKAKEASEEDVIPDFLEYLFKAFTESLKVPEVPKSDVPVTEDVEVP